MSDAPKVGDHVQWIENDSIFYGTVVEIAPAMTTGTVPAKVYRRGHYHWLPLTTLEVTT